MVGVENDDVIIGVEIKLRAIITGDAKRIHTALLTQFLDVETRITPIGSEYNNLLVAKRADSRRQLLHCSLEVVRQKDEVHVLRATRSEFLCGPIVGSEDALWMRVLIERL